jgi:hypothetical protein
LQGRQLQKPLGDGKPWSEMDLFDLRNSLAYVEAQRKDRVIPVLCRDRDRSRALGILAHAMLWFDMAGTRKPTEMNSKNMF